MTMVGERSTPAAPSWWRARSVRFQLTLWYVAAMVVVLAIFSACLLVFVQQGEGRALDARLRGDFRWAAEMAEQRPDGSLTWFQGAASEDEDLPWLQVWSPNGQLLFRTAAVARQPIAGSAELALRADNAIAQVRTTTVPVRVLSGRSSIVGKPVVLQVARSEAAMHQTIRELMITLALSLPLAVAAAAIGGYSLARRALAPVDRIAERARLITAERLSARLPIDNPSDELGRLAGVINDMLGRLESSFDQVRRFTADVSHQLRTPLTAIRSVGEVGLRSPHDPQGYRDVIGSMLEDVDRLSYLVDRLLMLSRAQAGLSAVATESIDLVRLADEVVSHLGVLAEEKHQVITIERLASPVATGDRVVLRQALINVVENAIKYTPSGGAIRLRVSASGAEASIEVIDSGPGIDPAVRDQIFDRFFRADGRDADAGGAGLGLAIAKWAVEISGGRLSLDPSAGAGATFRLTLPVEIRPV